MMLELLAVQGSLFEPSGASPLANAAGWASTILLGPLAVTLCVIAVALVGFAALSGRLPIRFGARVVLGCFVLIGAPVIASALSEEWSSERTVTVGNSDLPTPEPTPSRKLPTASSNPYAQASVRDDQRN